MKKEGRLARPLAWIEERSPGFHRFLVREDKPFPLVREALGILLFLSLLATVLWGATGQQFLVESPVVVVESGSMMHCAEPPGTAGRGIDCTRDEEVPYGRFGTIDPGDLIFVRDTDDRGDIQAWMDAVGTCTSTDYLECGCDGVETYGACGDVIIFRKDGNPEATPVIHRALFWLEAHGDGTFSIDLPQQWDGCGPDIVRERLENISDQCLARLGAGDLHGLGNIQGSQSGFITRGDNNDGIDQAGSNIEPRPVRPENILGKARGELPWLGLVKLFATDLTAGTSYYGDASPDPKVLMFVSLGIIIGTPIVVEKVSALRSRPADDEE